MSRVLIKVDKQNEELSVIADYLSNRELEMFSEILFKFSFKSSKDITVQKFPTPTKWTFLLYAPNLIDTACRELTNKINEDFGIELVDIKEV